MTEAPDKIFTCKHVGEYGNYYPEAVEAEGEYGGFAVEYVRADLARPVTVAEAAKVLCGDGYALEYLAHHACCSKSSIVEALRALSQKP